MNYIYSACNAPIIILFIPCHPKVTKSHMKLYIHHYAITLYLIYDLTHRRMGPVHFFLGGGGGGTHFFAVLPKSRIHARIPASPENLAESGGGGGAARPKL